MSRWTEIKANAILEGDHVKAGIMKELDEIETLPQQERWRKTVDIFLKWRPDLRGAYKAASSKAAIERGIKGNRFGENESGSMRKALDLPVFVANILMTCDPEVGSAFDNTLTPAEGKRVLRRLMKTFPEFTAAREI